MNQRQASPLPIPLLLWCPFCGARHVDEGEFAHRPHKVHTCQRCGANFPVALVPTVGVRFLPGCKSASTVAADMVLERVIEHGFRE